MITAPTGGHSRQMPKKHRSASPKRTSKHKKKSRHSKKHLKERTERPEKLDPLTGTFELYSAREGAVISQPASVDAKGRIEFTDLCYDIVGSGFDYHPKLVEREVLQLRRPDAEEPSRECYLSEVDLGSPAGWSLRTEKRKGSSSSESDDDSDADWCRSPEQFYATVQKDKHGERTGRLKAGAWHLKLCCQARSVTKDAVGEREYKRLRPYGYKKAVFLLRSVRLDTRNPLDAELSEEDDSSSRQEDSVSELSDEES